MKNHDNPRSPLIDATMVMTTQDEWGQFDFEPPVKIEVDASLACRNCGYALVEFGVAKAAAQKEYNYPDEDLDSGLHTIKVWCLQCAVADRRIADISEVKGSFYWEVH